MISLESPEPKGSGGSSGECTHERSHVTATAGTVSGGPVKHRRCSHCYSDLGWFDFVTGEPFTGVAIEPYTVDVPKGEPKLPRRPPYAVLYAVGGQEPSEVLVEGDAIVEAVDGHLRIYHKDAAIQGVLRVTPMEKRPVDG